MKRFLFSLLVLVAITAEAQVQEYNFPGNVNVSGPTLTLSLGTSQYYYGSFTGQLMEISQGTAASPVTSSGPTLKLSRTEAYPSGSCSNNSALNECNATLSVEAANTSADWMQVAGIVSYAQSIGTASGGDGDAVGISSTGVVSSPGTGIGTGAFLYGIRNSASANAKGAEIDVQNNTSTNCTVYYLGEANCVGIWTAANSGGTANYSSSALQIGKFTHSNGWLEGVTIDNNAVANVGFNDQSSSTTAFEAGSGHTTAFSSPGFSVDGSGNVIGNALNSTPVGNTTASTGAFTTLSASSTVSGTGFSTYLASPPAIGGTTPAAGSFTNLTLGTSAANSVITAPAATNANGNGLTFTATNGNGTSKNGGGFTFNLGQLTSGGQSGTFTITESPTTNCQFNDINGDGSTGGFICQTTANASATNMNVQFLETNTGDGFTAGAVPTAYAANGFTVGNSTYQPGGPFQYFGCITNLTCYLMGGSTGAAAIAGFSGGTLVGTWYSKQIFGASANSINFTGIVGLAGGTSGEVDITPQAAAGTYNFNLPTTAGASGSLLTSGGGGSSAMTWTSLASPPAIGGTAAAAGTFTALTATSSAALTSAPLTISGNLSSASALTNGVGMIGTATPNYTDTSGTGGTIANAYMYAFPTPNLETTTTTTYSQVATVNIPTPTCSSGGGGTPTCSARYALISGAAIIGGVTASGGGLTAGATATLGFNTHGVFSSTAANEIQIGNPASGTPSNQTLNTQGSIGGTSSNVAGGNLTIASGAGTGNATGSTFALQTPHATSSGTTQQTLNTQISLGDNTVAFPNIASNTGAQTGYLCFSSTGGNITYDGTNTCLVSARRFKKDIEPLASGISEVMQLKPVSFLYRNPFPGDINMGNEQIGFIAEDVAEVEPRLVTYDKAGELHGVRYEQMTSLLAKGEQDLQAEVVALKAQNAALEARLEKLERRTR